MYFPFENIQSNNQGILELRTHIAKSQNVIY
jgi:hypothetical protein